MHTIQDKKKLLNRVGRIGGQVAAVEKAIELGQDCSAILQTLTACRGAMNGLMAVLLMLMGPALVLRPAGIDALLIHAHDHGELHAHAIALSETQLDHDDHDHDESDHEENDQDKHSPGPSLSTSGDDHEFVVVFPNLQVVSSASPLRIVPPAERPTPPWLDPLVFQDEPRHARLLPKPVPPLSPRHCSLSKIATLLLLNHALLL